MLRGLALNPHDSIYGVKVASCNFGRCRSSDLRRFRPSSPNSKSDIFFTFTAPEREAIFSRRGHRHRLGAAIQIGFIKLAGCYHQRLKNRPKSAVLNFNQSYLPAIGPLAFLLLLPDIYHLSFLPLLL